MRKSRILIIVVTLVMLPIVFGQTVTAKTAKRPAYVTTQNGHVIEVRELWWGGVSQPESYSRESGDSFWDLDKPHFEVSFVRLKSVEVFDCEPMTFMCSVRLETKDGKSYKGRNYNSRGIKLQFPPSADVKEISNAFPGSQMVRMREENGKLYGHVSIRSIKSIKFLD